MRDMIDENASLIRRERFLDIDRCITGHAARLGLGNGKIEASKHTPRVR